MWIIEGLGAVKAREWGGTIRNTLSLPEKAVQFLLYHGDNDASHIEQFRTMLDLVLPDAMVAKRIIRTAEVTARLYALQIEEITP
jgi:3-oxoacyl-[acyl-carrier-protein] synthase-3